MATTSSYQRGPDSKRRRSQRVILSVGVMVRTENAAKDDSFVEETRTLVVNMHGALIPLSGKVVQGQTLVLTNRGSKEEQKCRVVNLSTTSGGESQVAVEFLNPSPDFWHIAFPPEDWVMPETLATS